MNFKDNELDQLANFLGNVIRVHREYYRLPHSTIQLAKISKLLMAMEKGSVKDIQGKSLDEIGGMHHLHDTYKHLLGVCVYSWCNNI